MSLKFIEAFENASKKQLKQGHGHWTKDNIINYTADPDEANDKNYPQCFEQIA